MIAWQTVKNIWPKVWPWFFFGLLFLLSTRIFWLRDFEAVGHNWDWTIPAGRAQLNNIDVVSRYVWQRPDLGSPSYLVGVHLFINEAVKLLGLWLTPKWVVFGIFLTVQLVAWLASKRLLDYLIRPSRWNYLLATLYAFSPTLFNDFIGGSWYMWVSYAALPFYFVDVLEWLKRGKILDLLKATVAAYFVLVATQNFFFITVILLVFIVRLLITKRLRWLITLKRSGALFVTCLVVNFYWVITQLYALKDLWTNQVIDAGAHGFGGWGQQAGQTQTLPRVFSLIGYWDRHLYFYALSHYGLILFAVAAATSWLAVGLYLLFGKRQAIKDLLFLLAMFILLAMFAKARNQPFGEVTMKIFESLPFLRL